MAGASVTVTRESRDIGGVWAAEVLMTLACVSDDANGLIPNQNINAQHEYVITEVKPVPDAVTPVTSEFKIKIVGADGETIFLSSSIAVDSKAPMSGANHLGWYPRLDATATLSIVDPADHTSTLSVGNAKKLGIVLRLEKKYS